MALLACKLGFFLWNGVQTPKLFPINMSRNKTAIATSCNGEV
ncbi:MAG: hypothetical protein SWX82_18085 [Cyanobacteriota bacterium]|nr:hypothetical protein [Cyanobacteriota bacterium]